MGFIKRGELLTLVLVSLGFIFFCFFEYVETSYCVSLKLHFPAMKFVSVGKVLFTPTAELSEDMKNNYFKFFIEAVNAQSVQHVYYMRV